MDIGKDLQEAYEQGRRDALNEIMEYTYGMLTAEKFGLQHKIKSMMSTTDTPQTDRMTEEEIDTMLAKVLVGQTDCDDRYAVRTDSGEVVAYACPLGCEQTDCPWK